MDANNSDMPRSKSAYVAQRLLQRILTSGLAPGCSFGTEAELLEQFDVSRPTLRESLRILEAQGVLALRPGPKGGIIVTKPGPEVLAHGLSVYLRLHDVPFISVLKTREALEPMLAIAAAENGSEEDFDKMQASVDRMKKVTDEESFIDENRVFHALIARASDNPALQIFWTTISILAAGDHLGIRFSLKNQQYVMAAHQAIVDALRERNPDKAAEVTLSHVKDLEKLVRMRYPSLLEQPQHIVSRQTRQEA